MREVSIQTVSGFDEVFAVAAETAGAASATPATARAAIVTRPQDERPPQLLRLNSDFMMVGSTPSVL
jgi:hypothetical protein